MEEKTEREVLTERLEALLDILGPEAVEDTRKAIKNTIYVATHPELPSVPAYEWTPVITRKPTKEEIKEGFDPKETVLDCEMPDHEQHILITTTSGAVEQDICIVIDGEYATDREYDWTTDITAWGPEPSSYKAPES